MPAKKPSMFAPETEEETVTVNSNGTEETVTDAEEETQEPQEEQEIDYTKIGFNDEADEEVRKLLSVPSGNWEKNTEWEFVEYFVDGDCQEGDLNPRGRTMWKVYGEPKERRDKNGYDHQPIMDYTFSRDIRYKEENDEKGKPQVDNATKLYIHLKDMYIRLHAEKPSNLQEIIDFSRFESYNMNSFVPPGSSKPFVTGLSLIRQPKGNRR